jgi:hypothetical protein
MKSFCLALSTATVLAALPMQQKPPYVVVVRLTAGNGTQANVSRLFVKR